MAVKIDIQGVGPVELGISDEEWEKLTDGERQEIVTRVAIEAGAIRPSQSLISAFLSGATDVLPQRIAEVLADNGDRIGLSEETLRALRSYAARQRAEAMSSYQRDPTVPDSVVEAFRQGDIRGGLRSLGTQAAESIGVVAPSVAATLGATALAGGAGPAAGATALLGTVLGTGTDFMLNLSAQRDERIRQGLDPRLSLADVGTAAGATALNLIPGARGGSLVGRVARTAGREAAESAAQSAATIGSVSAQGAIEGQGQRPSIGEALQRIADDALVGGVAGGAVHGVPAAARAAGGRAMDAVAGVESRRYVPENEELAQSERRLVTAVQTIQEAERARTGRTPPADEVIRTIREQQQREALALIKAAEEAGEINGIVANDLRQAVSDAVRHTKRLYQIDDQGNEVSGGLDVLNRATARIEGDNAQTGMRPEDVAVLRRTLIDMDVASQNFKKLSKIGPAAILGNAAGRILARLAQGGMGAAGTSAAGLGPIGALAAMMPGAANFGARYGEMLGRRIDRALGWQEAPIMRRAQALAQRVPADGTTTRDIQTAAQEARIRAAARRGAEAEAKERAKVEAERARMQERALAIKEREGQRFESMLLRMARQARAKREALGRQEARERERAMTLQERAADQVSGMVYRMEQRAKARAAARDQAGRRESERIEPILSAIQQPPPPQQQAPAAQKPRVRVQAQLREVPDSGPSETFTRPQGTSRPQDTADALAAYRRLAAELRETNPYTTGELVSPETRHRARVEARIAEADRAHAEIDAFNAVVRSRALAEAAFDIRAEKSRKGKEQLFQAARPLIEAEIPDPEARATALALLRKLANAGGHRTPSRDK